MVQSRYVVHWEERNNAFLFNTMGPFNNLQSRTGRVIRFLEFPTTGTSSGQQFTRLANPPQESTHFKTT